MICRSTTSHLVRSKTDQPCHQSRSLQGRVHNFLHTNDEGAPVGAPRGAEIVSGAGEAVIGIVYPNTVICTPTEQIEVTRDGGDEHPQRVILIADGLDENGRDDEAQHEYQFRRACVGVGEVVADEFEHVTGPVDAGDDTPLGVCD